VRGLTTSSVPLLSKSGEFSGGRFLPPGTDTQSLGTGTVRLHRIQPNFFEMLGIPLLRGRVFNASDTADSPAVVVITESLARKIGGNPIGYRFRQGGRNDGPAVEIVGVVRNIGISEVGTSVDGTIFYPATQQKALLSTFEVRTSQAPLTAIPAIREALRRIDPNLRASQVVTETELARRKLVATRYITVAWVAFGGVALLLTSIGLYGLLSHGVSRRTNEIGIRMALGARRFHVLRLVMTEVFLLIFGGLAFGLVLSLAVKLIRPFIYGVTFGDPLTFLFAALLMLVVAALASYAPARRAIRVDPTVALRYE
jgi:ABC-type antimicrobial peptide transport system permease subunit